MLTFENSIRWQKASFFLLLTIATILLCILVWIDKHDAITGMIYGG